MKGIDKWARSTELCVVGGLTWRVHGAVRKMAGTQKELGIWATGRYGCLGASWGKGVNFAGSQSERWVQLTSAPSCVCSGVTRAVDLCAAPGSWSQVLSQKIG